MLGDSLSTSNDVLNLALLVQLFQLWSQLENDTTQRFRHHLLVKMLECGEVNGPCDDCLDLMVAEC